MSASVSDETLLNKFKIPNNDNLNAYATQPIKPGSLIIKNGVMFILGGVSSGKSTLISKLIAVYKREINPIILSFYGGITPDETTTYAISTFNIKPHFIRLSTPEAMVSFFNQFRYRRLKLAELLMFLQSIYKNNTALIIASVQLIDELNINNKSDKKRLKPLLLYITELLESKKLNISNEKGFIYLSEYIIKRYAMKHKINFELDPIGFISTCLISFSKGFKPYTLTVDVINDPTIAPPKNINAFNARFTPYTFEPFIRVIKDSDISRSKSNKNIRIEIVPSVCIFDDVAQYPLLTTERSSQWIKDLFAETRRWLNTFIIAAQRHNLLNKTLRSLTHTFYIGYSLVDDDIPKIAKEIPTNLLSSKDFTLLYNNVIKPFTFFTYNNKLGFNVLTLKN